MTHVKIAISGEACRKSVARRRFQERFFFRALHFGHAARKIVPSFRNYNPTRADPSVVLHPAYSRKRSHCREPSNPRRSEKPRFPCNSCVTCVCQRDAYHEAGRAEKRGVGIEEIKKEPEQESEREGKRRKEIARKRERATTIATTNLPSPFASGDSHPPCSVPPRVSKVAATIDRGVDRDIYMYVHIYIYPRDKDVKDERVRSREAAESSPHVERLPRTCTALRAERELHPRPQRDCAAVTLSSRRRRRRRRRCRSRRRRRRRQPPRRAAKKRRTASPDARTDQARRFSVVIAVVG